MLTGESDQVLARWVTVDAAPLGHLGEALARLTGRATFVLVRHGLGLRLHERDRWQIGGGRRPAFADVVAEHRCLAVPLPTVPSALLRNPEGPDDDQPCPF